MRSLGSRPRPAERIVRSSTYSVASANANVPTPAQVALGWVLTSKPWIVPIPGTTKLPRLEENVAAVDIELTPADLAEIESLQLEAHGARYSERNLALVDR